MSSEPRAQTQAVPGLGAAGRGSVLCVRLRQRLSRLGGRRSGSEDLSVCRIRCFTFTSVFMERPEGTPRSLNPSQLLPPLLLGPAPSWAFTALPSAPGGVMCLNFKINRLPGPGMRSPLPGRHAVPVPRGPVAMCPSVGPPAGNTQPLSGVGPGSAAPAPGGGPGLNTRLKARFGCSRFGPLGPRQSAHCSRPPGSWCSQSQNGLFPAKP